MISLELIKIMFFLRNGRVYEILNVICIFIYISYIFLYIISMREAGKEVISRSFWGFKGLM